MRRFLAVRRGYPHLADRHISMVDRLAFRALEPVLSWRGGTRLLPTFVKGGRLLDIGCANGQMLMLLRSLGWDDLHGIEPDTEAAARAQATGADVRAGAVEDLLPSYPSAHFDAIVASMVIEHVADPYAVMREIARTLRPGGELLLSTVTRDSMDAAVFGSYWSGFDFPRHMTYFRNQDIAALFANQFDRVERFHQLAPIDWARSASWRGHRIDRALKLLRRGGWIPVSAIAALAGRSSRVSFRARRRGSQG